MNLIASHRQMSAHADATNGILSAGFHRVILSSLFSSLLVFSSAAYAGTPPPDFSSNHKVSLNIFETGGASWSLNMSGLLTYNPVTGALEMPAAGATLGEGWGWTTVDVRNAETGLFEQKDGVTWHTNDRNEDNSAWRSTITFYATGNVDPFLSYAFSARNTTAVTQTYSFTYGEPIFPPISGGYQLYSDIAGSITNVGVGTTAKIAPVLGDLDGDSINEVQTLRFSTDGGLTFFNAGVDVGAQFETSTVPGTSPYGVFASSLNGSSLAPLDFWELYTSFTLSPGRDAIALSGYAEIAAIPEPADYAVIIAMLTVATIAIRRRTQWVQSFLAG